MGHPQKPFAEHRNIWPQRYVMQGYSAAGNFVCELKASSHAPVNRVFHCKSVATAVRIIPLH